MGMANKAIGRLELWNIMSAQYRKTRKFTTRHMTLLLCILFMSSIVIVEVQRFNRFDSKGIFFKIYEWMTGSMFCFSGVPCVYPEEVDLRIILMTYNRHNSLEKSLESLDKLEMDGDTAILEIWIDRSAEGQVHKPTLKAASSFKWKRGFTRVHVQRDHVGIYGQWIDTWRPHSDTTEVCLFLEDDILVSPFAWRWLKASIQKIDNDPECYGYTLQSEGLIRATNASLPFLRPNKDNIFMYQLMGSWGFSPVPSYWRSFQDWFHSINITEVKPYVSNLEMTGWYKHYESQNTHMNMWTMWFIFYNNFNGGYCVYNNLNHVYGTKDLSLTVHRQEPGLHYKGIAKTNVTRFLLKQWSNKYIHFPRRIKKYRFDGNLVL